jgi:hypothetical protein
MKIYQGRFLIDLLRVNSSEVFCFNIEGNLCYQQLKGQSPSMRALIKRYSIYRVLHCPIKNYILAAPKSGKAFSEKSDNFPS